MNLVAACLLQAVHQLFNRSVYVVVLVEVFFYRGEVCTPLGALQQLLKHKHRMIYPLKITDIFYYMSLNAFKTSLQLNVMFLGL